MGEAAVAAGHAVGYHNAGTIEFLVDPETSAFYFLEMNTRLQVEHAVTELLVGLDLVQWQIRVAAGEHFPFQQSDLTRRGHALECRIYAEDPSSDFLPSTGMLLQLIEPRGPGIRLDSGVAASTEVTHFYDPLLAKLIVHAEDRPSAVRRMQAALQDYVVHGVVTNIDFLQDLLAHPDFAAGNVSTSWVENVFKWQRPSSPSLEALLAAAVADSIRPSVGTGLSTPRADRSVQPVELVRRVSQLSKLAFDNVVLDISPNGSLFAIQVDSHSHQVEVLNEFNGRLDLLIDGHHHAAYVSADAQNRWVTIDGRTFLLGKSITSGRTAAAHESSSELPAPMPGQVRTVNVTAGDTSLERPGAGDP